MKNTPAQIVNKLLTKDPATPSAVIANEILAVFPDTNLAVLGEWCREPGRRKAIMARTARRRLRTMATQVGRRGDAFRRIMLTLPKGMPVPGFPAGPFAKTHQAEYHATKGWRSYRVAA